MAFMTFAGTVLKNLFSEPATTQYPFVPKEYPERTRGHIEINKDACILCGMCMRSCPPGAIKVDRAGGKWTINRFDCIQCGYCTEKCPKKCLTLIPGYQEPGQEKFVDEVAVPVPVKPAPAARPAGAAKPAAGANKADAAGAAPAKPKFTPEEIAAMRAQAQAKKAAAEAAKAAAAAEAAKAE